jgi:hypothetical protein
VRFNEDNKITHWQVGAKQSIEDLEKWITIKLEQFNGSSGKCYEYGELGSDEASY